LNKAFSFAVIAGTGILLCCLGPSTYSLLVDSQLGLVAMASFIFMLNQGDRSEAIVPMSMVLSFLALIKNSSLLLITLVFIWSIIRYRVTRREFISRICLWIGIPLLVYIMYKIRGGIVYSGAVPYQAISLDRFVSNASKKDISLIKDVIVGLFQRIVLCKTETAFSVHTSLLILIVMCISMYIDGEKQQLVECSRMLKGILLVLTCYTMSLFVAYIVSFSAEEARRFAGFWRYYGTIMIVVLGVAIFYGLFYASRVKAGRVFVYFFLFSCICAVPGTYSKKYVLSPEYYEVPANYRSDIWRAVEIAIPQNKYYTEDSYLVLWDKDDFKGGSRDNGRMQYIAGAWLRSISIKAVSANDLEIGLSEEILQTFDDYDYLAVISDMSEHEQTLLKYFDNIEIGLHKIQHHAESETM